MQVAVSAISPVYQTAAVGTTGDPAYLNLVALIDCDDPEATFVAAQSAEQSQGRLRSLRWGPRTLDADVICVGRIVSDDPRLTLPHPRAHQRAFVLMPWLDVDPVAELPGYGAVRAIAAALADQQIERYADPLPLPR